MRPQNRTVEEVLAGLAFAAHGIVDRWERIEAGASPDQIKRRVRKGLLIPQFRGVYRVGHAAPSTDALYLAAVHAWGAEAYLCGLAAAHLYGLRKGVAPGPEVVARTERRVEDVLTHRCRDLDARDVTVFRRTPVVTVPRVLVEIAPVLTPGHLARACHEAGVRYGTTPAQVAAVLARRPNAAGSRNLQLVMTGGVKVTLSALEREFLRVLRAYGFPPPETTGWRAGGASTAAGPSSA